MIVIILLPLNINTTNMMTVNVCDCSTALMTVKRSPHAYSKSLNDLEGVLVLIDKTITGIRLSARTPELVSWSPRIDRLAFLLER